MPELSAIKFAGPAGAGIMSVGEIFFRSLVKSGYYVSGYPEYPSLIKGGHNSYLLTISDSPFPHNAPQVDLLLALTQTALDNEHPNIGNSTRVIADQTFKTDHQHKLLHQPGLLDIAKAAGNPLTLNTAMVGFASHQLKLNPELVWSFIQVQLGQKSQTLLDQNKAAFDAARLLSAKYSLNLTLPAQNNQQHRLVLNGSEAVGLGAIAAGINLYTGYPMTPSSTLLHFMAAHQTEYDYLVKQAEDEISAINLSIGGSFAGAKTMTGTAGGGFALMVEGLSLAGMLETPLVIYVGQRPAPATGLPTWTSQSDLMFVVNAGHGEFPRVVLAPSDPSDCYTLTNDAFRLSQTFHIPVIILSDKYLAENLYCLPALSPLPPVPLSATSPDQSATEMYSRYAYTPDGVHPRTLPGMVGGEYIANSDEHEAHGLVDESTTTRQANNQRRQNKMVEIKKNIPLPEVTGEGERAIISWGSHKHIVGAIARSLKLTHIHFTYLWPLPPGLEKLLSGYQNLICVENNETHQLARLIRQETGVRINLSLGNDDGRPLDVTQLINQIRNG